MNGFFRPTKHAMIDTGVSSLPGSGGLSMSVKVGLPTSENVRTVSLRNTFVIPTQEIEQQHFVRPINPSQPYELRIGSPMSPMPLADFGVCSRGVPVVPIPLAGQQNERPPTSRSPKQATRAGSEAGKQSRSGHRGKHCRLCHKDHQTPASSSSYSQLNYTGDESSITTRPVCPKHGRRGRKQRSSKSVSVETEQELPNLRSNEKTAPSRPTKPVQHEEETQTELPANLLFTGYTNLPDIDPGLSPTMNGQTKDVGKSETTSEEEAKSIEDIGALVSRICEMFHDLTPPRSTESQEAKQISATGKASESQPAKDYSKEYEHKPVAPPCRNGGSSKSRMMTVLPRETLIDDPAVQKISYPESGTRSCNESDDRAEMTRASETSNLQPIYDPRQVVITAKRAPIKLKEPSDGTLFAQYVPSFRRPQAHAGRDNGITGGLEEQNQNLRIGMPSSKIYEMCTRKVVYKQHITTTTTTTAAIPATTTSNSSTTAIASEPIGQVERTMEVKDQVGGFPPVKGLGVRTSVDSEASDISSIMRQKAPKFPYGLAMDLEDVLQYADDLSEVSVADEFSNTSVTSESGGTLVSETSNGCEWPLVTMLEQSPRATEITRRVQFIREGANGANTDGNSSGSFDGSLVKESFPRSDPGLRQAFICTRTLPEYSTATRLSESRETLKDSSATKESSPFYYTVQSNL